MKSNSIFVKFHTWLQSTGFVLVLRSLQNSVFENQDEKNQIRSLAYNLTYMRKCFTKVSFSVNCPLRHSAVALNQKPTTHNPELLNL
jgi:hypothetical protein